MLWFVWGIVISPVIMYIILESKKSKNKDITNGDFFVKTVNDIEKDELPTIENLEIIENIPIKNESDIISKSKLIKCPMCEHEISPNAEICPNCGEPMKKNNNINLKFSCLPSNLDIGQQIVNWTYDACVKGFYENEGITKGDIPDGKIHVILHEYGISIRGSFVTQPLRLHNLQIESITELSKNELCNKSVVGRAIIGGVLTGGLGAIIGGMSGIGLKQIKKYYLIINYWDIQSKELKSMSIGCDTSSKAFIKRFNNQKNVSYI